MNNIPFPLQQIIYEYAEGQRPVRQDDNGENIWEFEKIVGKCFNDGEWFYWVWWLNGEVTWEPKEMFTSQEWLDEYHDTFPLYIYDNETDTCKLLIEID